MGAQARRDHARRLTDGEGITRRLTLVEILAFAADVDDRLVQAAARRAGVGQREEFRVESRIVTGVAHRNQRARVRAVRARKSRRGSRRVEVVARGGGFEQGAHVRRHQRTLAAGRLEQQRGHARRVRGGGAGTVEVREPVIVGVLAVGAGQGAFGEEGGVHAVHGGNRRLLAHDGLGKAVAVVVEVDRGRGQTIRKAPAC